jgi:hypothetical protein
MVRVHLVSSFDWSDAIASRLTPTGERIPNVGVSLLAIEATRSQHSTALTAKPPREVSLYLSCISAPVSRMVRITRSSEIKC